jgi:hypothetical protein
MIGEAKANPRSPCTQHGQQGGKSNGRIAESTSKVFGLAGS